MEIDDIVTYYSNPLVKKEIAEYSKNRWIAIYTIRGSESGLFIRYKRGGDKPLTISKEEDVHTLIKSHLGLWPRTIYASANVYAKLTKKEDTEKVDNIIYSTPVWDIDGSLEYWQDIVKVARIILEELENEGVTKSVYLKWSGRGIHVQIHEKAFSQDILQKYHPLDISYSVVEYILKKAQNKLAEVIKNAKEGERPLKVENEMDLKRVFTAPLSLHKKLDFAVVCLKPNELDDFTPDWAKYNNFKHNPNWRDFKEGEGDNLAIVTVKEIGGYFSKTGEIRTVVGTTKRKKPTTRKTTSVKSTKKIGRFQVMALLQAARYYLLTGDLAKAKSFGLNRAIFYAWAKYHGRERAIRRKITPKAKPVEIETREGRKITYVGDEGAFISDRGWFIIGDKEQLPSDFDKEVTEKIETVVPFEDAWKKALEYLKKVPRSYLLNQQKFFNEVYKPVRDEFIEKVIKSEEKKSLLY
ncbi:MAG: hypothetical protein ACP6IS_12135 [Candidatus Asgardarchaeia archaeon]